MENVKKKINIALIGLGWVSTHRHLPTIAADERFKIVGVIDKHPGRAADIAKKYGCYSAETQDIRTVPWMNEVDAVTVSVQPMLHYEMIKTALMLNKHVITEKPFAMTVNEGQELVNLAREKHLKLGVVHNFQFASSTQKMIKDIEDGKYGAIKAISAVQMGNPGRRLPVWYEKLPLGLFYDESPHFFYLLSKLSPGPLEHIGSDIFPSTTGLNTPAQIFMKYRAKCGSSSTPVTVSLNFESPVSEWHLMIFGEKCLGDIDIFRDIYMCLPNDGLHVTSTVFR
ncbi:MAG TPA: Gfo/Idh/MocA family oxidoreductase, partial [Candidatus Omnitrophota bacterium]|nr:Gfo/Idh/MocA family oxidoreductase [Candidatus Omnitrophota bacterium]